MISRRRHASDTSKIVAAVVGEEEEKGWLLDTVAIGGMFVFHMFLAHA